MTIFSSLKRSETIKSLKSEKLDVLVIGGGITGAGISLDAVHRGLRTGLIEMEDYAFGTSSRSTKLVHGGLRYLKQFEIGLVAEVGKEREIVYENGPHVTTPEWMMLPFYKGGTFGPLLTNIGLRVYDFLAGVKKEERRKILTPEEALQKEPLLKKEDLLGAGFYVEYKTDDARLTLEVLKKSVELGTVAINYTKAVKFLYDENGKVNGVEVEDQITGEKYQIYAKKIINATGPWVDEVRELDEHIQGKKLHLTKGVHLVFPKEKFPLQQAIYFDSPDGRMIFAIPRGNKTYVGTTDTNYYGNIATPKVTEDDRKYLLTAIDYMFPTLQLTNDDIESSWAGLRPLISDGSDNPSEISRKDEIFLSKSGLYSIAGGKLTGYRKMAEQIVDKIVSEFKQDGVIYSKSETMNLPISGGDVGGSEGFIRFKQEKLKEGQSLNISREETERLIQTYGSNVDQIFCYIDEYREEAKRENIDIVVYATLLYAIKYEQAYKPSDYFIRRTGNLLFAIDSVERHQHAVMRVMEKILGWNKEQREQYTDELNKLIDEAKYASHE